MFALYQAVKLHVLDVRSKLNHIMPYRHFNNVEMAFVFWKHFHWSIKLSAQCDFCTVRKILIAWSAPYSCQLILD